MPSFMDRLLKRNQHSAMNAKERLQLVLIHDRTDLTANELGALKDELLQVISKYVDIDPLSVNIEVEHEGREQRLVADIPIRGARRRKASQLSD